MTTKEAAKHLGMNPGTLANYRSLGIGPEWTKKSRGPGGGRVAYTKKALEEWAQGNVCPTCGHVRIHPKGAPQSH